jgi:hypothetical protein
MGNMYPGKGVFVTLEPDLVLWLLDRIAHVQDYYPDASELEAKEGVLSRAECQLVLKQIGGNESNWVQVTDDFGQKVYARYPWQDGEYRVTVVLPKAKAGDTNASNGALSLDIRFWYAKG